MKFVIARDELLNLIGYIQNVVAQKSSVPILSNFMMEVSGNELVLSATDLTVGVRCRTEVKVFEEGAITLPAKKFFYLVKELTSSHIEITSNNDDIANIISGSSSFKINGINKNEYPQLPDLTEAHCFKMPLNHFKTAFYRTAFAVSKENHRPVLTGVLMKILKKSIVFVGTNGRRLAKVEYDIDIEDELDVQYVLPIKAVDEILRIPSDNEDLLIYLMQDKIAIDSGKVTLVTKFINGDYPDFTRIVLEDIETKITLHREELMSLLKQISLFTQDNNHSVKFYFSEGNLNLSANHSEVGHAKVSMPINYYGEPIQIAFNPNSFLDILRHSKDETVDLGLTDSFNPGVITDSSNAVCVLMPMRLRDD